MPLERVLVLQRSVGNRVVAAAVSTGQLSGAGRLIVQRLNEAPPGAPGRLDQAVDDLYGWLVAVSVNVPSVLTTLLLQKDQRVQLEKRYEDKYHRQLRDDLKRKLGWADAVRARCYLDYGGLRLADKIYLAIHGQFTDEATVMRVAPEICANRTGAEEDFAKSYGADYPSDYTLPDGSSSRIAGAIMTETLWATFPQRFKIAAVIAFGVPRAADDVKIATVSATNDADLLFNALQREDPKKIASDFEASYKSPIKDYLSRETSFHTKLRALMFFDENLQPEDRLIRTVEIATSGYTTADSDFIFDAVAHATPTQISKFKAALAMGDGRLKNIDATLGGLNKENRDRLNALLGIGDATGIMADPVVVQLRQQGGNGSGVVFEVLRNSTGSAYEMYRKAYADGKSALRRFVDQFTSPPEKGWLASYVFADFRYRLNFVMTNPGNDDYILFLLNSFAKPEERKALATDADFGSKFSKLGTAIQNKILLALEPTQLSPQDRAVWLDAAVKRETASGGGAFSGTAAALEDENRELQAAVARAGKNPTPEQQAEIDRLMAATKDALAVFVKYRDELEAAIASTVEMAAGLVAGVLTGGMVSVELALAAVARAALASAMAKVVANKLVKGDRFDVIGADGAQAFISGAVDGMLNVVAPVISKVGAGTPGTLLAESAGEAARLSAPKAFQQFAASTGPKMVEGVIVGGLSGVVDTATQDQTWGQGFDKGMRQVLMSSVRNAFTSGALAGMPPALNALVAAAGGLEAFEAIVNALPEPEASLEVGTVDLEPRPAPSASAQLQRAPTGSPAPTNWGTDFEDYATKEIETNQLGGQLPKMDILVSGQIDSSQGLDRIGFHLDGDKQLHIYHFEMKWRNPADAGAPMPEAKLGMTKTRGRQLGEEWTKFAITEFCEGSAPSAISARKTLSVLLPHKLGLPMGTVWTPQQLKSYLLKNIKKSTRVVVVPPHVNIKRLWMQLIALTRWDRRKSMIVKAALP